MAVLIIGFVTLGKSNELLFMTYHSALPNPLTYARFFTHVLGQQVYEGVFLKDNISNLSHVLGGIIGSVVGFKLNKKR